MVRTQIQLPDELYERTKRLAESKEISLAELVRRGLEYMLSIHPLEWPPSHRWKLEPPTDIGLMHDPFTDSDWRVAANMGWGSVPSPEALTLKESKGKKS